MAKFFVIELQTQAGGAVGNIVTAHDTQNAAESAYHMILASAAISELPCHAAVILTEEGFPLLHQCYKHGS